ncbi:SUMO protein smt3 [Teratosphaeriaceae sp. CCFEE 6253]|nr:SUMO protein smt3 [Teratosphaeriaceae sp. CCFEE 6253]
MAMRTIIDIPLGEYTAQCTIDVPLAAASVIVNGNTIGMIANGIAATIDRATRVIADDKGGCAAHAEVQSKVSNASKTSDETAISPLGHDCASTVGTVRHTSELPKLEKGLGGGAKRQRIDGDEEDQFPILDPRKESNTPSSAQPLHITLMEPGGRRTRCTTWPDETLERVFSAYAELQGMRLSSLRVIWEMQRIELWRTAASYDIEDGDTLDVFVEQIGS